MEICFLKLSVFMITAYMTASETTVYMTVSETQQVSVWAQAGGNGREDQVLRIFWICREILHFALYILHLSCWLCCMTLP